MSSEDLNSEHILTMPDTYVGSNNDGIILKEIMWLPGFKEAFSEIICSARDRCWEEREQEKNKNVPTITINIDSKTGLMGVFHDGKFKEFI